MVREGGLEPPCPLGHTDLNRARLPISPLALTLLQLSNNMMRLRTNQARLSQHLTLESPHSEWDRN